MKAQTECITNIEDIEKNENLGIPIEKNIDIIDFFFDVEDIESAYVFKESIVVSLKGFEHTIKRSDKMVKYLEERFNNED